MRAKKIVPASVPFEAVLDKHLKGADKKQMIAYLNACLGEADDDGLEIFFQALSDIARAKGIAKLASQIDKTRDTIYKMFNNKNPTLDTFRSVLNEMGMDFAIVEKR